MDYQTLLEDALSLLDEEQLIRLRRRAQNAKNTELAQLLTEAIDQRDEVNRLI
jgi:hypothetical protein